MCGSERSWAGWPVRCVGEVGEELSGQEVGEPEPLGYEIYAVPPRVSRTRLARADATDRPSRPLLALSCLKTLAPSRSRSVTASARENLNFSRGVSHYEMVRLRGAQR